MKNIITLATVAAAISTGAFAGEWRYTTKTDAFTDQTNEYAVLYADGYNSLKMTTGPKPEAIVVRCDNGSFDIFINAAGYVNNNASVPMRYRFDDQEPISEYWQTATSGDAAFLPTGYNDFRNGLKDAKKVAVEMTDFRGNTDQAVFTLGDNADLLKVYKACGKV